MLNWLFFQLLGMYGNQSLGYYGTGWAADFVCLCFVLSFSQKKCGDIIIRRKIKCSCVIKSSEGIKFTRLKITLVCAVMHQSFVPSICRSYGLSSVVKFKLFIRAVLLGFRDR